MRANLILAAFGLAVVAVAPAQAVTYTYTGTTAGGPTFNRPIAGTPPIGLSPTGTAVAYNALTFTVSAAGSYTFLDTSAYDNFMILYQGVFTPGSPLVNALVAADDTVGSNAGFTRTLATGTSYTAVMTSFSNTDTGAFTLTIDGPGNVTPGVSAVPEPASWAMMILGMGAVGGALRRRNKVSTTVKFV